MNALTIEYSPRQIADQLNLPPAVRVTGCQWDPEGSVVQIRIESPGFPEVEPGDMPRAASVIPQPSRVIVR